MRLPAIRSQMGIWRYYVSTMTFEQIRDYVHEISDEIHNSKVLSEQLQRAITDNVGSIKEYLLTQEERFFNALILAVYEGDPAWLEVEVESEEFSTYEIGLLELSGNEIIFPVDGQHRVKGIKEALKERESLLYEKVPVVFIAHKNDREGKQRTRRLFSTLNRKAKPVDLNDIIALDEDDVVAIVTRELIEQHILFEGQRLVNVKNRNIPKNNTEAFTSIITLYECNKMLVENALAKLGYKGKKFKEMFEYRPEDHIILKCQSAVTEFWDIFINKFDFIKKYLETYDNAARDFRNQSGGNLLFRPIALPIFAKTVIDYSAKRNVSIEKAIEQFVNIEFQISKSPWKDIIWNSISKTIIGRVDKKLIYYLLLFLVDDRLLKEDETNQMLDMYASAKGYEGERSELLNDLKECRK